MDFSKYVQKKDSSEKSGLVDIVLDAEINTYSEKLFGFKRTKGTIILNASITSEDEDSLELSYVTLYTDKISKERYYKKATIKKKYVIGIFEK